MAWCTPPIAKLDLDGEIVVRSQTFQHIVAKHNF